MVRFIKNQRLIFWTLIVCSIIYFSLFIKINHSGSDEISKIRILSSIDEQVQLNALEDMLHPTGKTYKRAIGDFLLHHHAYGYPFYFFSSLVTIPVKLFHLSRSSELEWMMLALRQQVVLFNILTCLLLTFMWTQFKRMGPSIAIFLFLLSIPAVNKHNFIWHPDALSTLFIVLTLFCLVKDNLRFKKWFIYSAISCGMACSTKFMGPFLFLLILTYLFVALKQENQGTMFILKKGILFGFVTGIVFVFSTPLILFGYYQNVIDFLTDQSKMNNFGWGIEMPKGLMPWYNEVIEPFYFNAWLLIGLLVICIYSIFILKTNKNLNLLILAAILPIFIYVVTIIAHKNYFYLYPVMLLLASTIGNIFYTKNKLPENREPSKINTIGNITSFSLIIILTLSNTFSSYSIFEKKKEIVSEHPAFQFYHTIEKSDSLVKTMFQSHKILHSSFIYLPDSLASKSFIPNDLITVELIKKENPDIIILEKEMGQNFTNPEYQQKFINPGLAKLSGEFYKKAMYDSLPGYALKLSDPYGLLLIKEQ
jgi:hypothetical protein